MKDNRYRAGRLGNIRVAACYAVARMTFGLLFSVFFRLRTFGAARMPRRGGLLLTANHQSWLDPVLTGVCARRRVTFMARRTLFDNALFGRVIRSVGAFPVDRDKPGIAQIKEVVGRLSAGEALLVFPEGTRSRDGRLGRFKPGFGFLARRAAVPVVPVWIEGSYEAWPPHRRLPRPGRIRVVFGEPIAAELVARTSNEQLAELVVERLGRLKMEIS